VVDAARVRRIPADIARSRFREKSILPLAASLRVDTMHSGAMACCTRGWR
jgi:hypothetical protein